MPPTESFNRASGAARPKVHRNYSHEQLLDKLGKFEEVAKTGEHRGTMRDIRQDYLHGRDEMNNAIPARNRNYRMGIEAGIHPKETHENIENADRRRMQDHRNRVTERAETYYHRNYSLSKNFKEAKEPQRDRNRTMDRNE